MNKKGFVLVDSLICVVIVLNICLLTLMIYSSISNFEDIYERYDLRINEKYENIFNSLGGCKMCEIDD